jgi:hypothetical protein
VGLSGSRSPEKFTHTVSPAEIAQEIHKSCQIRVGLAFLAGLQTPDATPTNLPFNNFD